MRCARRRNELLFLPNIFEPQSMQASFPPDPIDETGRSSDRSMENIFLYPTVFNSFPDEERFEFISSGKVKKTSLDRWGFANNSLISGWFSSNGDRRSVHSIEKSLLFLLMSNSSRVSEENRRFRRGKGRPPRTTCISRKTFRGKFEAFRSQFLGVFDINR